MKTIYKPNLMLYDTYLSIVKNSYQNFETQKTNYTAKIKTPEINYYFFDEHLSFKTLGLMQRVKSEILSNIKKPYAYKRDKIKFCVFNHSALKPDSNLPNCVEIDICSAYLTTALRLGYISDKTFNEVNKIDKISRLKVLGAIATRKWIDVYDGGKIVKQYPETNEILRGAWFHICEYVDKVLRECAHFLRYWFLFYFVDGIYLHPRNLTDIDIVMGIIHSHGYECKVKPVNLRVTCKGNVIVYDNETARPFFVKKKQIRKNIYL